MGPMVAHLPRRPHASLFRALLAGEPVELGRTPLTARGNINNVTNERYWNSAGNGLLGVGLPLTATFLLTARL